MSGRVRIRGQGELLSPIWGWDAGVLGCPALTDPPCLLMLACASALAACLRLLLPLGPLPSKDRHCFGNRALDCWNKLCLATLLDTEVSNPMEYEFNFQLEIRGPCLLAGKWS